MAVFSIQDRIAGWVADQLAQEDPLGADEFGHQVTMGVKADHRERCGATDPSLNYDWASLIDHPKSVDDFAPMCRPCHRKFDAQRDYRRPGWQGHNKRKLSADGVRAIRAARTAGALIQDLAAEYGVNRNTISRAISGETWGYIDGDVS